MPVERWVRGSAVPLGVGVEREEEDGMTGEQKMGSRDWGSVRMVGEDVGERENGERLGQHGEEMVEQDGVEISWWMKALENDTTTRTPRS